jgi:hypothetical protein
MADAPVACSVELVRAAYTQRSEISRDPPRSIVLHWLGPQPPDAHPPEGGAATFQLAVERGLWQAGMLFDIYLDEETDVLVAVQLEDGREVDAARLADVPWSALRDAPAATVQLLADQLAERCWSRPELEPGQGGATWVTASDAEGVVSYLAGARGSGCAASQQLPAFDKSDELAACARYFIRMGVQEHQPAELLQVQLQKVLAGRCAAAEQAAALLGALPGHSSREAAVAAAAAAAGAPPLPKLTDIAARLSWLYHHCINAEQAELDAARAARLLLVPAVCGGRRFCAGAITGLIGCMSRATAVEVAEEVKQMQGEAFGQLPTKLVTGLDSARQQQGHTAAAKDHMVAAGKAAGLIHSDSGRLSVDLRVTEPGSTPGTGRDKQLRLERRLTNLLGPRLRGGAKYVALSSAHRDGVPGALAGGSGRGSTLVMQGRTLVIQVVPDGSQQQPAGPAGAEGQPPWTASLLLAVEGKNNTLLLFELPDGWGFMAVNGGFLVTVHQVGFFSRSLHIAPPGLRADIVRRSPPRLSQGIARRSGEGCRH